jgi:hypothetical protein
MHWFVTGLPKLDLEPSSWRNRHAVSDARTRSRRAERPRSSLIRVRTLVPNVITLLALVAGLTAIRLVIEGKLEFALAAMVLASVLGGIDGRIARLIRGTSRFGAELDNLADFINFGVAPAFILYFSKPARTQIGRLDRGPRVRDVRRPATRLF